MKHTVRHTAARITRRLKLIQPLVYLRQQHLPPFRYKRLDGPLEPPPVAPEADDFVVGDSAAFLPVE